MNTVTALKNVTAPAWWFDPKMVSLVKRTAAADCNADEFDEFAAVSRELGLNPLRKQIFAFVFSKDNAAKRNMVIVVGIDGMRSVSARNGLYRPDNKAPRWTYDATTANPDSNPLGLVSCEVSIFVGHKLRDGAGAEQIEWSEVVGAAYWDEFAPIIKSGSDDDYEMVDTGEKWPDGNTKKRKKLKAGATIRLMLDPKKDGWRKSARHMLAKCAEAIAHRKANPEPFSRVYADEEMDRSRSIDGSEFGYQDMTPSEMAAKGETDKRMELIGGPAILASLDPTGSLERVPVGKFADKIMDATSGMPPDMVASFMIRNRVALQEFWGHNKTDALALKKVLEGRSIIRTAGPTKDAILAELAALDSMADVFEFAKSIDAKIEHLPVNEQTAVRAALLKRQPNNQLAGG